MKKVIVVSKTHLDLGFTDYAENIRKRYIEEFIPGAVNLAEQVNSDDNREFIWTTGSWILKEALADSDENRRGKLCESIKNGNIAAHAFPFTTHTELLDTDTLEYGLNIVDEIDKISGRKTVAAKMTDVPGHTKGLVRLLYNKGIKLLHIGVNGASALPEIPECFLWKNGDAQVVVIYSGGYGGAFESEFTEEILYLDHTVDNRGAPSPEKLKAHMDEIRSQYEGYTVVAGTLDDYAEIIWNVRHKLPVVEDEIGDTWIHGSATDPYKSASLRELIDLKAKWLADGSMIKNSDEYNGLSDALLCIAEHTCGVDSKMFFADYENYLKSDFINARKNDKVVMNNPMGDYPQNMLVLERRKSGVYYEGSYSAIEKSWAEQRLYIKKAVDALSSEHRAEAELALSGLIPEEPVCIQESEPYQGSISFGDWTLEINSFGGIGYLSHKGNDIISRNDRPIVEYRSYSKKDYDFWHTHYSRDLDSVGDWAYGDFGRPLLCYAEGKYPEGRFYYSMKSSAVSKSDENIKLVVNLECDAVLCEQLGAPRNIQITYTLCEKGLKMNLCWFGKDANRLTEAIFMHLYPNADELTFEKLGDRVNPVNVVSKGSRNLHAVKKALLTTENAQYSIINRHSPLISVGRGKILEFDNEFEDYATDGIAYVLYNNVWGTNFPLWYEDNASFDFIFIIE
ncbi:MAG: DUF5054 domain-containing protein [Clostridia bacterium]|nr:DUF5054 domain-containing protein [Clostridia bacterium]